MIVFGEDWGAHPSSTQHIIKHLIPNHNIVWMNSLGLRRPKVNLRDFKRAYHKLKHMLHKKKNNGHIRETPSPYIVHPNAISWPGNPLAARLNKYMLGKQVEDIIARHKFEMPILWASMPSAIDAIDNYPNHKVVYYCGDDFRALAGVDHAPVERMEERLAQRADLIIVSSETLQNRFPADKTILIEHGVDYELFSNDVARADDLPDHPHIAGFYGSIHSWIDLSFIVQAAQACPEWLFIFIGNVHIDISPLKSLKNVKFLGSRSHQDLPKYSQHWQVSMLPFKDCEQIRSCNPLKLKEYLSAGKPVVSTKFPALLPYKDNVHIMENGHDLTNVLNTLKDAPPSARQSHEAMASQTWAFKANTVQQYLSSL